MHRQGLKVVALRGVSPSALKLPGKSAGSTVRRASLSSVTEAILDEVFSKAEKYG